MRLYGVDVATSEDSVRISGAASAAVAPLRSAVRRRVIASVVDAR